MKDKNPLVSAAELEALIQDWGAAPHQKIDRFFPIRFWYLALAVLAAAVWLLLDSSDIAQGLSKNPDNVARLQNFLYFRGWFLLGMAWIGIYAYVRNWYPAIVYSVMLLIGLTNLVNDIFNVYGEQLADPKPFFTFFLLVRISLLWVLYMSVKNASRLPAVQDRLNPLLPFRRRD